MNPLQIVQMLSQNPQQILNKVLGNSPIANNLIGMINKNDSSGIEQMARNLAKEKGIDPDKMYNQIKEKLNM